MTRTRSSIRPRLSHDVERLCWLASGVAAATSRFEGLGWESQLEVLIKTHLENDDDTVLNQALAWLLERNSDGYHALIELIESCVTQRTVIVQGETQQVLLIGIPVLVGSRYRIPTGALNAPRLSALKAQLQKHIFAPAVVLNFVDHLYSPDQLPEGYIEAFRLASTLLDPDAAAPQFADDGAAANRSFLADVRYLIGTATLMVGAPLFHWQKGTGNAKQKLACLTAWRQQGSASLTPLLTGCEIEVLKPDILYDAWRQAEIAAQPFVLRASVTFLARMLALETAALHIIIAPFHELELEEYRISFMQKQADPVIYGLVWALLDEDSVENAVVEIESILRSCGVRYIQVLDTPFPLEQCEDCNAPLFVDSAGDLVHAEMPTDKDMSIPQLH